MSDAMNEDEFKKFEDLLKNIEDNISDLEKKKMNSKNNNNDMVWFSMNPQDMEFKSSIPTEFKSASPNNSNSIEDDMFASGGDVALPNGEKISPDLANFMLEAGMLFYDALYMPLRSGKGRLTDLFSWIERARDRMEQEDFTDIDRTAFTEWCRSVALTLLKAQAKHGLWLTDDEEDLVAEMKANIFSHNGGEE